MGGGIIRHQVVGVARRHQRQTEAVRNRNRALLAHPLDVQPVVLNLDVEVRSEQSREPLRHLLRLVELVTEDAFAKLARRAAAQADEPLLVRFEQLLVDPRHVVQPFKECDRRHLDKVAKAGVVAGQERQVIRRVAALGPGGPLAPVAGRDVGLVANDRVDARRLALAVKLDRPIEVAVVGEGQRVHAAGLGVRNEFGDAIRAVEQAVMAVTVQMHERPIRHATPLANKASGTTRLYDRTVSRQLQAQLQSRLKSRLGGLPGMSFWQGRELEANSRSLPAR